MYTIRKCNFAIFCYLIALICNIPVQMRLNKNNLKKYEEQSEIKYRRFFENYSFNK
jgi:hypothetical protein